MFGRETRNLKLFEHPLRVRPDARALCGFCAFYPILRRL
ncbi:hypothetical protein SS05631_c24790 [Sinorhizobium sp. CCBAU 05631]|nr:hypothetical protein SS05631_c24790 [Sinorhizobium sp. CCBAU 05631]